MRLPSLIPALLLLVATFICANAVAAPVTYEFRGTVGTRDRDGLAKLPAQLTPDTHFVGTLSFDPARTEDGAIAPVVSLSLRTLVEGTVVLTSESHPLFSKIETRSTGGVESVLITAAIDMPEVDTTVHVELSWASPGQGQLPADPRTLNILALQPYGWKIAIVGFEWVCYPGCDFVDERIDAHIWNIKRQAANAEYEQNFTTAPSRWTNTGGNWTTQSGFYANAANVAFTSSIYGGQTLRPFAEVRAELFSGFTGAGNALGLLLNYQDAANFYEVRFTGNGVVTINKVVNGARTMLQTGAYSAPPQRFFRVSVLRDFNAIEVRVNDATPIVVEDDFRTAFEGGRAGVFSSFNRARFDNFAIDQLSPWLEGFSEGFSSADHSFEPRSGTWVTENGVYRNTSSQSAAISTGGAPRFTRDFAVYTRMNLQWSGAGNRGGLVYDFQNLQNYRAVLVSPRTASRAGRVEVIEVANGVRRVLASSTDVQLAAGQWGEVSVMRADGVVRIAVTGMSAPYITLRQNGSGEVGVISSFNLVRFDDFVFRAQNGPIG